MVEIKDAAVGFEAVKVSMSQDRNGIILRLNVHPNDCPQELHTDWVGTRYMVAMVRLTDDDQPDVREDMVRLERLIASAGLLCRNQQFGSFLIDAGLMEPTDPVGMEEACVKTIRNYCGVMSRSEFRENPDARRKFETLREEFILWKKS